MDLLRIAARVAAGSIPSREAVDAALAKAWQAVIRPFEIWNTGGMEAGGIMEPKIGDERRTRHVDLGGGWEFVLKAEHGGYGDDEPGDFITLKFLNPVTKSADLVYEGPERLLGLSEADFDEMVDAAFDAMAIAAASGDEPS